MQKRFWVVHREALEQMKVTSKKIIIDLYIVSFLETVELFLRFFVREKETRGIIQIFLLLFFTLLVKQCDT